VQRAVRRLRSESRDVRAWVPRIEGDPHAGRTETSLQLALAPDRVGLDRAAAGDTRPIEALMPLLREGTVRGVSGNGVLGDPGGASAAEGVRILDSLAADLIASVREWLE
jgi:creatinine amidohydrolase